MKCFKRINYLIIFLIVFAFFAVGMANADVSDNVSGWAWSENIGWISFNCVNENWCATSSYGVDIDETTGVFFGYAWAGGGEDADGTPKPTIGWIAFADYDGSGTEGDAGDNNAGFPCFPNCEAKIDTITNEVSGWARALAHGDGWDGWIKLRKDPTDAGADYGVSLNISSGELEGFAWGGGTVVDSISFNHLNCDPDNDGFSNGVGACPIAGTPVSNYKVTTTAFFALPNSPPTITDMNDPNGSQIYCDIGSGLSHVSFDWKYNDADGDDELKYDLIINDINNVNDTSPEINITINSPACIDLDPGLAISCINTSGAVIGTQLDYNKTYYWWAKVYDDQGNDSGWAAGLSFDTPDHPWPWPDFTHSPQNPGVGEIVIFTDESQCWTTGIPASVPCKNLGSTSYGWDFDYNYNPGIDSTIKGDATTSYPITQSYDVRLHVSDELGACIGTGDSPVGAEILLPEWKETSPIILIKIFLAGIFNYFNELISL
ncbi:hypothetical protein KAS79_01375 [Candidatus Parcubacteria bacterium]|nr:hypothetical protein [Candidatus Parcubacteria bacterium]